MKIGSLFSGIGGLELGLERAGLGPVTWQVEVDPFCQSVLERHWPDSQRWNDVRTFQPTPVDLVCGGFPCQPHSVAGARRAQGDERWLWPEFARIATSANAKVIVIENVPGLLSSGLRDVLSDLARLGFDACWHRFAAADLGAPHIRERIYVVATHAHRLGVRNGAERVAEGLVQRVRAARERVSRHADTSRASSDAHGEGRLESAVRVAKERGWAEHCGWSFDPASRVDDGIPRGTHGQARKALGNAVVVPCAELVGRAVVEALS